MPSAFSYAIVRVVPHVEREEFVNAGVVVFCDSTDFLGACIALDEARLLALAPDADLPLVRRHLAAIPLVCAGGPEAGPIGALPARERWQWLVAPRSTVLQMSPAHTGLSRSPDEELARLAALVVTGPVAR
jgi:hypothetical protein